MADEPAKKVKDKRAVELGRKGGMIGGPARAAAMTPAARKAVAKHAADSRWDKYRARVKEQQGRA